MPRAGGPDRGISRGRRAEARLSDNYCLNDLAPELVERALALSRGQSGRPMEDPFPLEAWPDVPTRYLLCRDDGFFDAAWTREMVRDRLGFDPDEMDGGHMPYLSRPDELVERLEDYRSSV